ncbi:MAG: N-acetylmuramoyl-L-alanine amidase [Patescibacteria group bacterium]|nr:N-acetylmuramoyl-L-alanine amidase [Patescibacteria group bacterium]
MKTKTKKIKIIISLAITFLLTAFLFMDIGQAEEPIETKAATLSLNNINSQSEYISSVYQPSFDFNMLGFKWTGQAQIQVRAYQDEWSDWYWLEEMEPGRPETTKWHFSDPIFFDQSDYFQFKITKAQNIDLEVTALNTLKEKKLNFLSLFFKSEKAKADDINLDIISRSQWEEADEKYRFEGDTEVWPAEYEKVTKFIIHHTAGSTGEDDPKAVIRGIYYWHAIGRDWGDIGYNYLIDTQGNIYEGRFGGDGVIAGHALGYNDGTVGISILGDYQHGDELTNASKEALTNLMAKKAQFFGFNPSGSSEYKGEKLDNILGHRDVGATSCPGDNIYNQFDEIISQTQTKYDNLPSLPTPQKAASYHNQSDESIEIDVGEEKEVWVDFKNQGNTTWKSYVEDQPKLIVKNNQGLQASDWLSDEIVTAMDTANVAPGRVGRFKFKIKGPTDTIRLDQTFYLKWGDNELASASIHLEVRGFDYAANSFSHNILPATFPGTVREVTLFYKNIGLKTWEKDDIYLKITDENGNQNQYNYNWPDKIRFNQDTVTSQATASFTFQMKSPSVSQYRHVFKLYRENGDLLAGSRHSVKTRVDSTYQAEIVDHNVSVAMLNSWHVPVTLKFKNIGLQTWDKNVVLKVYDGDWRNSAFSHQSWPSDWGNFSFQENRVRSGEVATFNLTLFPPPLNGTYYTIFKLEKKNDPSIAIQGEFRPLIRVDESGLNLDSGYRAEFQSVSAPPALLQLQRLTTEVKIKNTGTVTWGSNVVLNIYDADYRETYFRDQTWNAFEGAIHAQESYVRPGETATFRFVYRAPWKTGLYRNRFKLSIEGKEYLVIPGSEDSALTRVDVR